MSKKPVRAEDLPYRPCVGVMVLNRQGLVWAGRRTPIGNSEYDGSPQLWQMPQGGIDKGEDPEKAAYRELYEETGMETVELLGRSNGVGFQIHLNFQFFDVAAILAYTLTFVAIMLLIELLLVQPLERHASRWR